MKILLENGRIYDPRTKINSISSLYIEDGIISAIDSQKREADTIVDCRDKWIIPSITDMHVHCFKDSTKLSLSPDWIGIEQAVGNLVDAGSCGSNNIQEFIKYLKSCSTNVKLFINYSSIGLTQGSGELSNFDWLDEKALEAVLQKYSEIIKGIKLRASQSVVKDKGVEPIRLGAAFAHKYHLPVMVHVGNEPPKLDDVFNELRKGDIVTHIYHGKKGGIILEDGSIDPIAVRKYEEGVLFDVGHGSASFSFNTAEKAIQKGLIPHLISSDLHSGNFQKKISSLAEVVTKIYNLGLSECQIVDAIAIRPAQILDLHNEIKIGGQADISIISFQKSAEKTYRDSDGKERIFDKEVVFEKLIRKGGIL